MAGKVEVICGSMFSGKTEELIRRVRRAIIAKQKVQIFKPMIDNRFGLEEVKSHDGTKIEAIPLESIGYLLSFLASDTNVVAIDEAQFFDSFVVSVVETLAAHGIRVIVAGLDTNFRGEPFGFIPDLVCIAEEVTKLRAICEVCGNPASRTQRLINGEPASRNEPEIKIGAGESYQARCREHHEVPIREIIHG